MTDIGLPLAQADFLITPGFAATWSVAVVDSASEPVTGTLRLEDLEGDVLATTALDAEGTGTLTIAADATETLFQARLLVVHVAEDGTRTPVARGKAKRA